MILLLRLLNSPRLTPSHIAKQNLSLCALDRAVLSLTLLCLGYNIVYFTEITFNLKLRGQTTATDVGRLIFSHRGRGRLLLLSRRFGDTI